MNLGRAKWLTLLALSLGISMIIVDATIVNVAIPSIVRDLGLDGSGAEWIVSVYPLVFAALLITLGRTGDIFGRRRLYIAGLVIFVGSSMLAGLAPTGPLLIAARILQGVGGAAIAPATQSILNATFRGRERADRVRRLRIRDRRHGGPRAAARRLADHQPLVALGVPHQPADRDRGARGHAPLGGRVPRRARQGRLRCPGLRHPDVRAGRHRLRPHRGLRLRLAHPQPAVHDRVLDLAAGEHLDHPRSPSRWAS